MVHRNVLDRFSWLWQLLRYIVTGGINTLLSYVTFAGLIVLHLNPYAAQGIGYTAGMITSFLLNAKWTFSRSHVQVAMAVKFLVVNLLLLMLSELLLHLILVYVTHSALLAQLFTLLPITAIGFILNRTIVFNR